MAALLAGGAAISAVHSGLRVRAHARHVGRGEEMRGGWVCCSCTTQSSCVATGAAAGLAVPKSGYMASRVGKVSLSKLDIK